MTLKIGAKFSLVFLVVVILLVVSGFGTWTYSSNVTANYESLNSNTNGIVDLTNIERGMWELRLGIANYPGAGENGRAKIMSEEAALYGDMKQAMEAYSSRGNLTVQQIQGMKSLKEMISACMGSMPQWFELFNAGKLDEAQAWREANTDKYAAGSIKAIQELIALQHTTSGEVQKSAGEDTRAIRIANLSFIIIATLIAMMLGYLMIRSIIQPLHVAVALAGAVAQGDLTRQIETESRDEFGQLMRALKDMNSSLSGIVGNVRNASAAIATGANEIAQGNTSLANRTEAQASSLQKTALSMEKMTSTVKVSTESVRHVNQLAQGTSGFAEKSSQEMDALVQLMNSIHESSRKIVDIIVVIENIAFQTNILALNAAVEAAHAGVHGRGFAVVAGEVRNLAHRSAAAAKEIKILISDEVQTVSTAFSQVTQVAEEISDVVTSVQLVASNMKDIFDASTAQSANIADMNQSISQMGGLTQQNAMAEGGMAGATELMKVQSKNLLEAVSMFKLDTTEQYPGNI